MRRPARGRISGLRWLPAAAAAPAPGGGLAGYVNPFIGTQPAPSSHYGFGFDTGDVFPGAVAPHGMLAWSPDTTSGQAGGGAGQPVAGNAVVANLPYRNSAAGTSQAHTTYVFAETVPLASGKTVASVTLPARVSAGQFHVFAIGQG
jgi:putative alpha-1,2-mannosidase